MDQSLKVPDWYDHVHTLLIGTAPSSNERLAVIGMMRLRDAERLQERERLEQLAKGLRDVKRAVFSRLMGHPDPCKNDSLVWEAARTAFEVAEAALGVPDAQ